MVKQHERSRANRGRKDTIIPSEEWHRDSKLQQDNRVELSWNAVGAVGDHNYSVKQESLDAFVATVVT